MMQFPSLQSGKDRKVNLGQCTAYSEKISFFQDLTIQLNTNGHRTVEVATEDIGPIWTVIAHWAYGHTVD